MSLEDISEIDYSQTKLEDYGVLKADFKRLKEKSYDSARLGEIVNGRSRLVLSLISDYHARLISMALLGLDIDKHDNFFQGYSRITGVRTIPMFDY